MDTKVEEAALKMTKTNKKKTCRALSSSSSSFSSLPDEIVLSCLARVSKSQYHTLCLVSKSFYSLLSSPDLYSVRSELGVTESHIYVCMWEPYNRTWFTLNETNKGELSLIPTKLSSSSGYYYAKFNTTAVAAGSEIYLLGAAPSAKRSKSVVVIDCRNHTWRRGPNMTVARKNAQSCFSDGKIYVIGGCIEKDKAMNWGEVFNLNTQTWMPLSNLPSDGYEFDPHHKVAVVGARLHVFTKNNKYAYDPEEGRWVVQEFGFVGLDEVTSVNRPWCIIENVIFTHEWGDVKCYNTMSGKWDIVDIVNHHGKLEKIHKEVQLVNHGGKLVIIWDRLINIGDKCKNFLCAVIRLEKGPDHKICGKVERFNVVMDTVPESHMLSSCLSVSF